LLWLLIATQHGGAELAIATWSADRARPRVVALHVDRTHVVPSDAETAAALASASNEPDLLAHAEWLDTLGRDALTRRFYRTLEHVVAELGTSASGRATQSERAELALLYVSRLLFLGFLQTKGWLDRDRRFLAATFARSMEHGGNYHRKVLLPLFFGTLNTPPHARAATARTFGRIPFLNGGLFARTPLEHRCADLRFPDDTLGLVFGELLARYRFTPREETSGWSEAAVDPEMLGKAFESLMEARSRRSSGAFFTPRRLVATVSHAALTTALTTAITPHTCVLAALRGEPLDHATAHAIRERCASLAVLDPACGSGAFLVHILEELSALRSRLGDPRQVWELRRELLTRSIFGVDINPTAVWLCELRLWLSVVIECEVTDPLLVPPLPNLDRHIRIGDSLAGDPFGDEMPHGGRRLARMRERYARSNGPRKHTLRRALERAERTLAITHLEYQHATCSARRRDLLAALRGRDLFGQRVHPGATTRHTLALERAKSRALTASLRRVRDGGALPFAWVTHFPDIARRGGFDAVLGNPPWVRLHRIPSDARADLRRRFVSYRAAAWTRGASASRAGPGFAAQVDLAALFAERSISLLRPLGTLSLLLPAKLWRALAGGGLRALLRQHTRVTTLEDWSDAPREFEAAVYPSLLVAQRIPSTHDASTPAPLETQPVIHAAIHRRGHVARWMLDQDRLSLDYDPASPWVLAPPNVRDAFDRLASAGVPLAQTPLGAPQLGVKCGLNDAFIVHSPNDTAAIATVHGTHRAGRVERALLRPLLRGETVTAWRPGPTDEWIVWTHDANGVALRSLPPHTHAWLRPWRSALAGRADARTRAPWWTLFRTNSARTDRPRVVWADIGRAPRALVLAPGNRMVALNSCYVLPCTDIVDAYAVAALLNSPLVAAWLHLIAEPARAGYRRFLSWTISLLPIPRCWSRARNILAPLAERASHGDDPPPSDNDLLAAALEAYALRHHDIDALLQWPRC
jgi:hypothetical protein